MSDAESNLDPLLERCAAECLERGWRLAWLMLRHREDAADAVQSAFVVALRKRGSIPQASPWPWLAAVIAREALHIRRKRARAASLDAGETPMPQDTARGPLAELERRERETQLARALDELPAPERDALLLTRLGGLTYAQAAQSLGVPLGTFNHQVSRALAELRRKLREDEPAVARALAVLPILAPPPGLRETLAGHASTASGSIVAGGIAVKKSTSILAALLVALLIGAGSAAYLAWPREEAALMPTSGEFSAGAHEAGRDSHLRPPSGLPGSQADESAVPAAANHDDIPDPTLPTPTGPQEFRVLIATDAAGKPVEVSFLVEWRLDESQRWNLQRARTGAGGRADLDAPIEAVLRLNIADEGWVLSRRDVTIIGGEREAAITVFRAIPARVRVTYADGKPYLGLLIVSASFDGGPLWQRNCLMVASVPQPEAVPTDWGRGQPYSFHEIVEFEGLPAGAEITFRTTAERAGYSVAERLVTPYELADGGLIEVVIPEGVSEQTPGRIVLEPPPGQVLSGNVSVYRLTPEGARMTMGWPLQSADSTRPESPRPNLESGNVSPGRYTLYIFGKTPWYSGEFEVMPGETKVLRPSEFAAATLRARIVDDRGNPVAGAVLSAATGDLPNSIKFKSLAEKLGHSYVGEAISGSDGIVSLENHPAGTFKFQVYAARMQPWEGFVTLVAGQQYDMGDIRIERAKGRVEVVLPDWDFATRKLSWSITDADGGTTFARGSVESNTFVIEGLAVGRAYVLKTHIPLAAGARAFWYTKPFQLTAAAPKCKLDGSAKQWPQDLD